MQRSPTTRDDRPRPAGTCNNLQRRATICKDPRRSGTTRNDWLRRRPHAKRTRLAAGATVLLELAFLSAALRCAAGEARRPLPAGAALVAELYASEDPCRDPLEIEPVRAWDEGGKDEGGIHVEALYFTGQIVDGVKTRVYALRAWPLAGDRLPGILHCHGGGQTAYLEWVRFWARRGYSCVSFDYSGDTNRYGLPQYRREHFTRWGTAVEKMMAVWASEPPERRSPRGTSWYHFCLAARRAATLLEESPGVDRNRLGAFGVSAGGYLSWLLAATDRRIKTIVPIYGIGGGLFRDERGRLLPADADMERRKFVSSPDAPELCAPLVTCPVFFLTATNDGSFDLDRAPDTLDRLGSSVVRMLYTPRYSHHIEPDEGRSLPLWMAWQLKGEGGPWPATPRIGFGVKGGKPLLRVEPDAPGEVARVEIYYAIDAPRATSRFWRDGVGTHAEGASYVAAAPFLKEGDRLHAFATVAYRGGFKLSTPVVEAETSGLAGALAGALPTLRREALIDDMADPGDWYWVPAYPDPKLDDAYFGPWAGPAGERGFTVVPFESENPPFLRGDRTLSFSMGTHKIGDPQWRSGADVPALLIDVLGARAPQELSVRVVTGADRGEPREWSLRAELPPPAEGWAALRLDASAFRDSKGGILPGWGDVRFLELSGVARVDRPPVFRSLRWAEPFEVGAGVWALGSSTRYGSANFGWVAFGDHVLLVGAPHPDLLARALAAVAAQTSKPVRGAILTHVRSGEIESVKALTEMRIPVVASSGAAKALRAACPGAEIREFSDRLEIADGVSRVELISLGRAAGPADAAAFVHGARVLFSGELCANGPRALVARGNITDALVARADITDAQIARVEVTGAEVAGADTELWIRALERLEALPARVVVPGFGTVGGPEALVRQRGFLRELRRQVAIAIARGLPRADAISSVRILPDRLVWWPYDSPTAEDIGHVYRELTVPEAPLRLRPFAADGARPRVLALVGDNVHDPETIEAGLAPAFAMADVEARFLFDPRGITAENLKAFRLLVILRDGTAFPSGTDRPYEMWMVPEMERAVVEFVEGGGGLLALHNATGAYPPDGPYLRLLGGAYEGHGPLERFRVRVLDPDHPITRGVPDYWVADEQHTPKPDLARVHLLLESRSDEGVMGHAGWAHEAGRGRVCYLGNGHTRESLEHPAYQMLLENAVRWCLRR